ncbi:hypothetical protein LTR29_015541 [Friedmanniomyces endolithicus]|nr:hypothetical protein LTR01_009058 [Friedmanniomyces endolithicus]KAK0822690.1 hypothetical protein LTR73_009113 [Friedmanniomyces endolithicus]KAK0932871.1 hypothetical protein LTR29_015541 [Friedmanniomyces endolithicus]
MPVKKRLSVSVVFGCRLLVAPVIALRLWQLSPPVTADPNTPPLNADILTEGALELAFMLASITCLKPVMKPFHSGYVISTAHVSGGGITPWRRRSRTGTRTWNSPPRRAWWRVVGRRTRVWLNRRGGIGGRGAWSGGWEICMGIGRLCRSRGPIMQIMKG